MSCKKKRIKHIYINWRTIYLALVKAGIRIFNCDTSTGINWNESYQVWAESKQSSIRVKYTAIPVCLCTQQWFKKYVSETELHTNSCSNILSAWFWLCKI